jgi:hypothetical protein
MAFRFVSYIWIPSKDAEDMSSGEPGASEVMSLLLGDDELEEQCT